MKKSIVKSVTAYQLIRDGILSGEYLPGSRLVLADLQKKLGLGQGPVRDALMRLDKSGLVENIPFKGAVVSVPPSLEEMATIYQTRRLVETQMALAAARKMTATKLKHLTKLVANSRKDIDEAPKFFWHDRTFHLAWYAVADMPHVLDIFGHLNDHVDTFLNTHSYDYEYRKQSIEHHEQILVALKNHDIITIENILHSNIQLGFDYVQGQIPIKPSGGEGNESSDKS